MKTQHLLIVLLVACVFHSHAAVEFYFAEDVSPYTPVSQGGPNSVPTPAYPNSRIAASNFWSRIGTLIVESFENVPRGSTVTNVSFGSNVATFTPPRSIDTQTNKSVAVNGTFATSGTNFVFLYLSGSFTVSFNTPQSVFGFFALDIENNQFRLRLVRTNQTDEIVSVPVTVPQGSGGVCFVGLIDKANPFKSVMFENVGSGNDGFGFDDFVIAVSEQVRPAEAQLQLAMCPGLCISGTVGCVYRVDYCADLKTTNWIFLANTLLQESPQWFFDVTATNSQRRFYRAVGIE